MCGQSPLYVPTTINAQIRNIDAVDVAATSISCTNLTVNGEPVSSVFQNIGSSTPGNTVFTGTLTADNFSTTGTTNTGAIVASSANITGSGLTASTITSTGTISALSVTATGDVSGATLTGTIATPTQNSITKVGTQTSLVVSGSTTLASLSASGNITQSAGSTTLKTVTSDTNTISSGNTLAFAGTTAQQKVNLQSGTYGIGVSSNQLNLVTPTTGALVYYGGGTNADGTERFRVNSTGVSITGNLSVSGNITTNTSSLITSANTGTAQVNIASVPTTHNRLYVTLSNVGLSTNNSVVLRVGQTSQSSASIYSFTTWQRWSSSQSVVQGKNTTGLYLSGALNNNEKLYGTITLEKVGSGTNAEYTVYGLLKATGSDETIQYTVSGFIVTGYEIGHVGLTNPNSSSNFNVTGSRLQVVTG